MNKVTLEEFDKAINELPKTNDMVSTFSSVSVKELRKAIERFEYVPSFDDLLKENNRLNNIINELEKDLDYEINDYTGNIDMKEETLSGEFCRGIAWEADYLKNRIKKLKEGK